MVLIAPECRAFASFLFFFYIILLLWKPASSNCINANNFPSFKAAEVRDQILASAFQAAGQTFSDSLKAPKGGGEREGAGGLINFSYRTSAKKCLPAAKGAVAASPAQPVIPWARWGRKKIAPEKYGKRLPTAG